MRTFRQFNWDEVAKLMGGHLARMDLTRGEAQIYLPPGCCGSEGSRTIIVSDNGGEVSISEVVPLLDYSVPYEGSRKPGQVDDLALACRLSIALRGDAIDYEDPAFWAGAVP